MSVNKKWFLVIAVVISAANVWGQAAPSPFTTYGIGERYGNQLIHNQGSGIGISQPQYWYLNNQNPALLVFNTLTVFQIGAVGESRTLKGDTLNEKNTGGNLNYIVTAFPVKVNKWTTSIGLMPYTDVNFGFQYADYVRDQSNAIVDTLVTSETGAGGLTQVYWSNGVRLTKDISVGLKAAYLFGPISNVYSNVLTTTPNQGASYLVNIEDKTNYHGANFGLGFSFSRDSLGRRQDRRFSVGVVYNFATDLTAKTKSKIYRTTLAGDTIERYNLTNDNGKTHLPDEFSVGVSYSRGLRWSFGTEFSYQNWTSFKSLGEGDQGLGKSWRVGAGGEYTMDPLALENYLKRITFRLGGTYEQYPFKANNNTVKDLGVNFGFSLPTGRSSMDFGLKVGKRGNKKDNILEESYFKLFFGITFNDQWFIRRKFD